MKTVRNLNWHLAFPPGNQCELSGVREKVTGPDTLMSRDSPTLNKVENQTPHSLFSPTVCKVPASLMYGGRLEVRRIKILLWSNQEMATLCSLPRKGVESTGVWEGAGEGLMEI